MVAVPVLLVAATIGFGLSFWRHIKQNDTRQGVVVRINGVDHTFPLSAGADVKECIYAAVQFCSEHGSSLGFTMANIIDCVRPLTDDLTFKTHASSSSSSSAAASRRKGGSSGSSSSSTINGSVNRDSSSGRGASADAEAMPPPPAPPAAAEVPAPPPPLPPQDAGAADNRVGLVASLCSVALLHGLIRSFSPSLPRQIPVVVNGVSYLMEFPFDQTTSVDTAGAVALAFCQQNAQVLGFTEDEATQTETMVQRCAGPMLEAVFGVAPAAAVLPPREARIRINGVEYTFEYPPDLDVPAAAARMSVAFCRERGADLGMTPEVADDPALFDAQCVQPLMAEFMNVLTAPAPDQLLESTAL